MSTIKTFYGLLRMKNREVYNTDGAYVKAALMTDTHTGKTEWVFVVRRFHANCYDSQGQTVALHETAKTEAELVWNDDYSHTCPKCHKGTISFPSEWEIKEHIECQHCGHQYVSKQMKPALLKLLGEALRPE